ncbi:MAG TPA: DNA-deoxyinosine glycosylase [Novosphingobium sp.]
MTADNSGPARKHAFAPVVAGDTRVLVLGSLPGEASLAAARYYAHPRNQFWMLMGAVLGRDDLPALPYEDRLDALLGAGIGLWDTIASAQRAGSLDTALRAIEAAPLPALIARLPALRCLAFNGGRAAQLGRRALAGTSLPLIELPSSSPAHAALSLAAKRERWLALAEFLR